VAALSVEAPHDEDVQIGGALHVVRLDLDPTPGAVPARVGGGEVLQNDALVSGTNENFDAFERELKLEGI
jgi:hypothetical protein